MDVNKDLSKILQCANVIINIHMVKSFHKKISLSFRTYTDCGDKLIGLSDHD
jgi:hypothetical protein